MRNLRADILELFAGLDGRDRYDAALERRSAAVLDAERTYAREYAARRYRCDPDFRARHIAAMVDYRDRLHGADRPRRTYGPVAITHGSYVGYSKRKCRCSACRRAAADYKAARRAVRAKGAGRAAGVVPGEGRAIA